MTEQPPRLDTVPCGADPNVQGLMAAVVPCRCGSRQLIPVSDADEPPTLAIACDGCGVILGDAGDLNRAVANWNAWASGKQRHAWVPTESDAGEVCCLCGAYANTPAGDAACPEPEL
jgi:hypothetical protein